jgi:hypothetical protein
MNYPEYVIIGETKYKINTDFRIAIKCNEISNDESIDDYERALAIIYVLFGEKGLNDRENHKELLIKAKKYLACGKDEIEQSDEEPDMDFSEDMDYIEASFMSDYGIDLTNQKMHWWKFFNLINGLSNSDMGNCCVLNRIRNLRNYDTKDIKDPKELAKIEKAKKAVALKKKNISSELSENQKDNINKFYEQTGIKRRE